MAERENDEIRREILANVRRKLAASPPRDSEEIAPASAPPREQSGSPVERFRKALDAVAGRSVVVRDVAEAASAVRELLDGAKARRVAVSDSKLVRDVVERISLDGVTFETAPDRAGLFDCDAGITSAQWAVAETGTLVLESDRERHRLASLVPPIHVAIVDAGTILHTLGELLRSMDALSRTVTFVTGPSRTSDIELTLAIGVHGPGRLHVVIVDRGSV